MAAGRRDGRCHDWPPPPARLPGLWRPLHVSQHMVPARRTRNCAQSLGPGAAGTGPTAAGRLAEVGCSTREIMSVTGHASLAEVERYTREAEQHTLAEHAIARLAVPPGDIVSNPLKRKG